MQDTRDCTCRGAHIDLETGKLVPNDPDHICGIHGSQLIVYCSSVPAGWGYEPAKPGEFDLHRGGGFALGITKSLDAIPPHDSLGLNRFERNNE